MIKDPKLWAACQRVEWVAEGHTVDDVYNKNHDKFKADLKLLVDTLRQLC